MKYITHFLLIFVFVILFTSKLDDPKQIVTKTEKEVKIITRIEYIEIEKDKSRIKYTKEEKETLEKLVMCEAGGETFLTQLLTASAIINRVESEEFPNTLSEVIYQNKPVWQFTPVAKKLIEDAKPSSSVKEAVKIALEYDYASNCTVFNNKSLTADNKQSWFNELELVYDIDSVQFRRTGGPK